LRKRYVRSVARTFPILFVAAALAGGAVACGVGVGVPDDVAPLASVTVADRSVSYPIAGTAGELRDAMNARGPRDAEGERHDGLTTWRVSWTCAGGRLATVHLDVETTLPHASDPPAGFRSYVEALSRHERGHRAIGIAAANRVASLPAFASCEGADAAARRAVAAEHEHDASYDLLTLHGATQGATF